MSNPASPIPKASITYGRLVGQVIEHHRRRLTITQEQMAKAFPMSQSAYSRLEQGQSSLSVTQLHIIAKQLQMNPALLIDHTEQYARKLHEQKVEVILDKPDASSAAGLLIGLGILTALFAAAS